MNYFTGKTVGTRGYPATPPYNTPPGTMWKASGDIGQSTALRFFYNDTMDTTGGQSGSPLYLTVNGIAGEIVDNVIGIQNTGGTVYNGATRIDAYVFSDVFNRINTDPVPVNYADLVDYDEHFGYNIDSASASRGGTGSPLSITANIRNNGTATATNFDVSYYLASDYNFSGSYYFLGQTKMSSLAPFNWQASTWSGNLPAGIHAGNYRIGWFIDNNSTVPEYLENNQAGWIRNFTFTVGDDLHEQNDTRATATDATTKETLTITGNAYDEDWYKIDLTPGFQKLAVTLNYPNATGDVDLELYSANGTLLAGSYGTSGTETLNYLAADSGTHYLRVYPYNGNHGNHYSFTWDDLASTDLAGASFSVAEDILRPGQTVNIALSIANNHALASPTTVQDIFLSADDNIPNNDLYLGGVVIPSVPGYSVSSVYNVSYTLPPATHPIWAGDARYRIGMLVDAGFVVAEPIESNNFNVGDFIDRDSLVVLPTNNLAVVECNLTFLAPAGREDRLRIRRVNEGGIDYYEIRDVENAANTFTTSIPGALGGGTDTVKVPVSAFSGLMVLHTLDLNDGLTIDTSGGALPNVAGTDATASSVLFTVGSRLHYPIVGPAAGVDYKQFIVNGALSLTGADLSVLPGYTPTFGQVFTIIPTSSINGIFNGLPENAAINAGSFNFRIHYTPTTVTLTAVPALVGLSVNEGSEQRSRLTKFTFNTTSNVNAQDLLPTLTRTSGGTATTVGIGSGLILSPASGSASFFTITFANTLSAGVDYASLADGYWQLAVPALGYMSPINSTNLRRLFGDFDSNGTVDTTDFGFFPPFGSAVNNPFDFNNNGDLDSGTDFAEFGNRFSLTL